MPKQMVSELRDGGAVDSVFSVKYKKPASDYRSKSGAWFTLGVSDMTGEIELKFWGGPDKAPVQRLHASIKEDDVVHVVGTAKRGMDSGRLEIHVGEETGRLEKAASFNAEEFVPKTRHDIEKMSAEITETISGISEPGIKRLMESFFGDRVFADEFRRAPAAITMHHACIGGLLEHTTHVLWICRALAKVYPQLDKDLLFSGAILHDIGKTKEFRVSTNIKQTPDGMLRGHITIGQEMLLERMGRIAGFPDELKIKIAHIMLSHHGNGEYGSPVEPKFAEAEAIYYADICDAKLDQHITTREEPRTDDFRVFSRKLGRHVYIR